MGHYTIDILNILKYFLIAGTYVIFSWFDSLSGTRPPPSRGFEITLRHITLDRTPLA
jgi:hypothetical protein